MKLLFGPTLGFVFGPADFGALNVTVLDERGATHCCRNIEGNLLVFDETVLPVILVAFLLLLRCVSRQIGGVAPGREFCKPLSYLFPTLSHRSGRTV